MPIANAMGDCVLLPEDIIICILVRLPVKSILRFKSVCKPWLDLFSTPEFIKMHHRQFSSNPRNQSFIVHRTNKNFSNTMSLFDIESRYKKPMILDHPFSYSHIRVETVGCVNGLFCVGIPPFSSVIILWNPAVKLSKGFTPLKNCGFDEVASLGFGYDSVAVDFKVVRIVCLQSWIQGQSMDVNGAEVYSVNSDSWITIKVDFQFSVFRTKCDLIVNGNPYWVAMINDDDEVLICFDVIEMVFKIASLSTLCHDHGEDAKVDLVECNGSLGALVCPNEQERAKYVDVWVFDGGEQIWKKSYTFGPIEVDEDKFLQCSKNGKVLGSRTDGKLFVINPKTGIVKDLFYAAREGQSYDIFGYTESLIYINGMRQVELRKRKRKITGDASR